MANKIKLINGEIIFELDDTKISSIRADQNGNIDIGSTRIINIQKPINNHDATNKLYVDDHITDNNNPHTVNKIQLGLGYVENIKNNFSATEPPNNSNNIIQGYTVGSRWLDILNKEEYICLDSTENSAIWKHTSIDIDHDKLTNIGTFNHKDIDNHIQNNTLHRIINDTSNLDIDLWSAKKIGDELVLKSNIGHTHLSTDITDFDSSVDSRIQVQKGVANGLATLNNDGKIPTDQLEIYNVTKLQLGLDNVENIKNNFIATNPPIVSDDINSGYSIGSRWVDTNSNKEYICFSSNEGLAVWKDITRGSYIAHNIGSDGVGIFKSVIEVSGVGVSEGDKLEFKKLNPISDKIKLVDDIVNDKIDIDVLEENILLANLGGILPSFKGGTGLTRYNPGKFLHSKCSNFLVNTKDVPDGDVVGTSDDQVLANKTIDALDNTIINIDNSNIKIGARIDVEKIGDGSIEIGEFKHLRGISSNIQQQFDTHLSDYNNPHQVTKVTLGLSHVLNTKVNFGAISKPTKLDDSVLGYTVGSRWINNNTGKEYLCIDNSREKAVWVETTQPAGESNIATNIGSGEGFYINKIDSNLKFKTLLAGTNVHITSNPNEVVVNSNNSHSFLVTQVPIEVTSIGWDTLINFPYHKTEFSNFKNGTVIFEAEIFDRNLDIRVLDYNHDSVLGSHSTITRSGFYSFVMANPSDNARIRIQIKKSNINGTNPRIYGLIFKYDS